MSQTSRFALAFSSALMFAACGGGSSGDGTPQGSDLRVDALRHELFAAGIEPLPAPPPASDELIALGQALFFDKVLSGNEEISCAMCHLPEFGTSDGRTLSNGVHGIGIGPNRGGGEIIPRNSPSLTGLHLKRELFWDGRVRGLAGFVALPPAVALTEPMKNVFTPGLELFGMQAMLPPVSREEMRGMPGENEVGDEGDGYNSNGGNEESTLRVWNRLTERLLDLPGYVELLRNAYPGVAIQDFNFAHVGNAIAAFETHAFARTDSAFERFVRGDDQALTSAQLDGALEFFGQAGCVRCHSGSTLSDQQFHNTGLPQLGPGVGSICPLCVGPIVANSDIGRENVTGLLEDRYTFRTPSLLNVELTAPYGHAGQFATLRDMVAHYRDVVVSNTTYDINSHVADPELVTTLVPNSSLVLATVDARIQAPNDFDVDAIVEFLRSLTADDARDMRDIIPDSVPSGQPLF